MTLFLFTWCIATIFWFIVASILPLFALEEDLAESIVISFVIGITLGLITAVIVLIGHLM